MRSARPTVLVADDHAGIREMIGTLLTLEGYDVESRRSVLDLAHLVQREIGRLYKVVPTALLAASMRPSIPRAELHDRIAAILETLRATGANLAVHTADEVLETATEPLETRGIIAVEHGVYRVRERHVLRYYGRSLQHLLTHAGATH